MNAHPPLVLVLAHGRVLIGRDATRGRNFLDLQDDFRRALRKTGVT